MTERLLLTCIILICIGILPLYAQSDQRVVGGTLLEASDETPLPGANIILLSAVDSSIVRGTQSDVEGNFQIQRVVPDEYILQIRFVGYKVHEQKIDVTVESVTDLLVKLEEDPLQLDELRVAALAPRMEVRGDTTAFSADAYRLNRDASAEELVRRMPGFTIEGGRVQAQGEDVRRVTVDGSEFFGDDAVAALRNLPAEIISQVEVFDRQSDQAQFTGFFDGNTDRTINIRTRPGMNNGRFGRVGISGGTESTYMAGGNANLFNGPQRISVLGMSNNINQQNFATEDLAGVAAGPARGGGRGGMMRGRGSWGGGGAARDFLVGQQNGVSSVNSFGLNYIDRWNDSWNMTGSYFFNLTDNTNDQVLERRFLSGIETGQIYDENLFAESDNYNHRVNGRIEYTIDERNSLIITPRASFQINNAGSALQALTMDPVGQMLNQTTNQFSSEDTAYNIANTILFRHSFEQPRRTLSVNLRTDVNESNGEQFQIGETFFGQNDPLIQNQLNDLFNSGYNLSANIQYTEPLGERSGLNIGYNPGLNNTYSRRNAFETDAEGTIIGELDPTLSNRFDNNVYTHRVSAGFRSGDMQFNYNIGFAYQYTLLRGEQEFPIATDTRQTYNNLLPNATVFYRLSQTSNFRINYRTNTRTPSANQLQDVIDNTNPLQLSSGNPDLNQSYSHNFSVNYRTTNPEAGRSFMVWMSGSFTENTIGTSTFTAIQDTVLANGVVLGRGARFSQPENTGNSWALRTFMNYGLPIAAIASNLNWFSGITYSETPTIVNNITGDSKNLGLNSGLTLNSNISERVEFTLSYRASYNIVENSLRPEADNNYYAGRFGSRVNLLPWGRLVLQSELNVNHFEGLSSDFNRSTVSWNAAIGYKFLKNEAAEIKFSVVDILNQNNNINRSVTDEYVQDLQSNVLSRYFLMSFTYNFRVFTGMR